MMNDIIGWKILFVRSVAPVSILYIPDDVVGLPGGIIMCMPSAYPVARFV